MSEKLTAPAAACAAALLLLPPALAAQDIGRLFSTIEERLRLDEIRDTYDYEKRPKTAEPTLAAAGGAEEESPPAEIPPVDFNGIVRRSSGNDTLWINGDRIPSGQATADGIQIELGRGTNNDSVRLMLPNGVESAPMKPGQRMDFVRGTIDDTYRTAGEDEKGLERRGAKRLFGPEQEAPAGGENPAGNEKAKENRNR